MTKQYPAHAPRDAFAARLRQLHRRSGSPHYEAFVRILPEVLREHPQLKLVETVTFSKSGISEVLNGRREGLPTATWVACFVLCCQKLAAIPGRVPFDPDGDGLPAWQKALSEAEEQAERLGLPIRGSSRSTPSCTGEPPHEDPVQTSTETSGPLTVPQPRAAVDKVQGEDGPAAPADADTSAGIHVSEAAYEHIVAFGEHAHRLVEDAMVRQPDAVYKVAILLSVDRAFNETAVSLVTAAATTGHHLALELLQASPRSLNRGLARAQALQLARDAATEGDHLAANTFYECALWSFTPSTRRSRPPGPGELPS